MRDFLISAISFAILAFTYWAAIAILFLIIENVSLFLGLPDYIAWFAAGAAFVLCHPLEMTKNYSYAVFSKVQDIMWRKF